jgi:hypothetical protein
MRNKAALNRTMEVDMSLLKNRRSAAPAIRAKEGAANSPTFPAVPGRAFSRRHLLLLVVVAGALLALLAGGDIGRPARAAATPQNPAPAPTPDYSNVTDILNGRRQLLRCDDLAVVAEWNDKTVKPDFKILQTTDGTITNDSSVDQGYTPEYDSAVTLTGRMFAFAADIFVTVFTDSDSSDPLSPATWRPGPLILCLPHSGDRLMPPDLRGSGRAFRWHH